MFLCVGPHELAYHLCRRLVLRLAHSKKLLVQFGVKPDSQRGIFLHGVLNGYTFER